MTKPFSYVTNSARAYFLDAPFETGKTFSIFALQFKLRMLDLNVIAVATSAVAASLLEGRRNAFFVYKITIPSFSERVYNIYLDSKLACTVREANLIIWCEIVMQIRYCVEDNERT